MLLINIVIKTSLNFQITIVSIGNNFDDVYDDFDPILTKILTKMTDGRQAGKQASRQAGKQASRQAGKQASRQKNSLNFFIYKDFLI